MDIPFTKDEYRRLLELVEISDWVLHAYKEQQPADTRKHHDLVQKVYSYAEDYGCGEQVEYDQEHKVYRMAGPPEEAEEIGRRLMEFENDTFWEELIQRLAERDLVREVGEVAADVMDDEEWYGRIEKIMDVYRTEFVKNGISGIEVKRR